MIIGNSIDFNFYNCYTTGSYKSCNFFLELQITRYYIYFDISSNALVRHNM